MYRPQCKPHVAADMNRHYDNSTGLCSLGLADNRIGDEGAQSLSELVRHNDTLEKLILSNNHIRDIGAGQLVAALSQNSSLKGLYLAGNTFGDSFSVRCNEVIGRHNNTLTTLDIRNTRLSRPAAQSVSCFVINMYLITSSF